MSNRPPILRTFLVSVVIAPLIGSLVFFLPIFALVKPPSHIEKVSAPGCVTTLDQLNKDCFVEGKIAFYDARLQEIRAAKLRNEERRNLFAYILGLGGGIYLMGLVPAIIVAAYVAYVMQERKRLNTSVYCALSIIAPALYIYALSHNAASAMLNAMCGIFAAGVLYFSYIKCTTNRYASQDGVAA